MRVRPPVMKWRAPWPAVPFSETDLLLFVRGLGPGLLVDVGAHVGTTAEPYLLEGWSALCFEPEPHNREELERRLAPYSRARISAAALSERSGERVPFYVSDEHWGIHGLSAFHPTHRPAFELETTTLTHELAALDVSDVAVLKIDVEGADLPVLRGLAFERWRPRAVVAEFMDERSVPHFGWTRRDLIAHLETRGYVVWVASWSHIDEYGRRDGGAAHRFLHIAPAGDGGDPHWGNVIAIDRQLAPNLAKAIPHYLLALAAKELRSRARTAVAKLPGARRAAAIARRGWNIGSGR